MDTGEIESDERVRLTTARLLLRPPEPEDARAIAGLADNPRIAHQTARMPYPYRERDALEWIDRAARSGTEVSLAIETRDGARLVGAAGFGVLSGGEVEIGYWVGEPFWGRGYATEAVQAVIDHAFAARGLPRLNGRCRVGNMASRRVLEKCGFQYQGAGMVPSRALRSAVPTDDFCLERFVWESLKRWGRS
jgi:RimJ/RimL family protein N-acetyltransferase